MWSRGRKFMKTKIPVREKRGATHKDAPQFFIINYLEFTQ